MSMSSHQSARMTSDVWLTPPELLEPLGGFDIDPCAAPEPRPWKTASRHIAWPDNGLTADWGTPGARVWLNPPYSRDVAAWMRRMAVHGNGTALVFARTETSWFAESVWGQASGVLFLHGRIRFCYPDGRRAAENGGAPSVLVAYGEYDAARLAGSGVHGTFVRWERPARRELPPSLFDLTGPEAC